MNMNLKGKIGRLPEAIREGVNVRSELAGSEPDWKRPSLPVMSGCGWMRIWPN